jgi:hypothetical protein
MVASEPPMVASDPAMVATGPGPVPATDEAAWTAGVPPHPSAEPLPTTEYDRPAGHPGRDRRGTAPPGLDQQDVPGATPTPTFEDERSDLGSIAPPRPAGEPGWAPGEPAGTERHEPAVSPTGATDLRFHEADLDRDPRPEERSPLERAKRRLERLVSAGQAPSEESEADHDPTNRDAAERARRERLGLDHPDDLHDR